MEITDKKWLIITSDGSYNYVIAQEGQVFSVKNESDVDLFGSYDELRSEFLTLTGYDIDKVIEEEEEENDRPSFIDI